MNMTPVQIVYSSLFARWAWVVQPRNLMLFFCHVSNVLAQSNQLRRAFEYQVEQGKADEVRAVGMQAGAGAVGLAALVMAGPRMQATMVAMSIPGGLA